MLTLAASLSILFLMDINKLVRKPDWIRVAAPKGGEWKRVEDILQKRELHTVCDEARCPNKSECWSHGTATFMILGDVCTRGCRFCAVATAKQGTEVRLEEAEELALAIEEMKLRYAVITSVDRDDLTDRGSGHFALCIKKIKERVPSIKVEVLIPDYVEGEIEVIVKARPDVIAHNVETCRRLQSVRDQRASFDTSLRTLRLAKELGCPLTKSSMLLGLGETEQEIFDTMDELRRINVDVLVLGQYLQPSTKQIKVVSYIEPEKFEELAAEGKKRGFSSVVAGPFARTSYHAMEAWEAGR
ncbi:lipoyl synthase [Treponema sp.]